MGMKEDGCKMPSHCLAIEREAVHSTDRVPHNKAVLQCVKGL